MCDLLSDLIALLPAGADGGCRRLPGNPANRRERDFLAGRALVSELLARHGIRNIRIPRASNGAPRWPSRWTGSISHCDTWVVAVVAPSSAAITLGVDVERIVDWNASLRNLVLTPSEIAAIEQLAEPERNLRAAIIFSAKECIFKALNPVDGQWLDFTDAECVAFGGECLSFILPKRKRTCHVRWRRNGDHVLTLAAIPLQAPVPARTVPSLDCRAM